VTAAEIVAVVLDGVRGDLDANGEV